jgi:predicted transcriptional regulator
MTRHFSLQIASREAASRRMTDECRVGQRQIDHIASAIDRRPDHGKQKAIGAIPARIDRRTWSWSDVSDAGVRSKSAGGNKPSRPLFAQHRGAPMVGAAFF